MDQIVASCTPDLLFYLRGLPADFDLRAPAPPYFVPDPWADALLREFQAKKLHRPSS